MVRDAVRLVKREMRVRVVDGVAETAGMVEEGGRGRG